MGLARFNNFAKAIETVNGLVEILTEVWLSVKSVLL